MSRPRSRCVSPYNRSCTCSTTGLGLSGRTVDIADLVDESGSGWQEIPTAAQETADVEPESALHDAAEQAAADMVG